MSKLKDKICNKVGIKSDRTKNIAKHIGWSFIYKGGSILASFLLVPLTIDYLDTENYGVWLTLSSFIAWFSFFDVGLGNGLRNKFAEAKAKGDLTLAKGYVSTAYFTIGTVSLGLIITFISLNFFIDWTSVFNTSKGLQHDLSILMPIVFGFFCLQLVVKLITTIYIADQQHSTQGKITFITNTTSLVVIWLMTQTSESSLLLFGVVFSVIPVAILVMLNFIGFNKRYNHFKPSIKLWKKEYIKDIFGLGFKFFIIQISGIIIFSTDSLIISKMLSPKEVVPYQIAFKYFSIATMIFAIIISPYWSSFTEAYTKGDFDWIKKSMNNLLKYVIFFILLCIGLLVVSDWSYTIWLGDTVKIPLILSIFMVIYVIQTLLITPFTIFINGTGKVYIQTLQGFFSAIINIPLSIYFVNNLNFGSAGVILATIISLIPSLILAPFQSWQLLKGHTNALINK